MTIQIPGLERAFRGDKPVYLARTDVLADAIAEGHLPQGARLPTHRALVERLGVTTATVTRAYIEAERRGLVRGEVGRGTFVRAGDRTAGRFDFGLQVRPGTIDLALNLPPVSASREEESLFARGLGELTARADVLRLMHYQPAQILAAPPHRFGRQRIDLPSGRHSARILPVGRARKQWCCPEL